MKRKTIRFLLILGFAALSAGCLFPDNSYLMELNRKGKWRQAEAVGLEMLENRRNFTEGELSETYFQVIYALTRQEKNADARELMRTLDRYRREKSREGEPVWLERELNKLRTDLESPVTYTPGQEVQELNRSGNWAEAERRARMILNGSGELAPLAFEELQFNLIYSLARQGKAEEARREADLLNDYRREKGTPEGLLWLDGELEKLEL